MHETKNFCKIFVDPRMFINLDIPVEIKVTGIDLTTEHGGFCEYSRKIIIASVEIYHGNNLIKKEKIKFDSNYYGKING